MRSIINDRVTVITIFASLVAWLCVLGIFWAQAIDPSGLFSTSQLTMTFLGFWFVLGKRNFFINAALWMLKKAELLSKIPIVQSLEHQLKDDSEGHQQRINLTALAAGWAIAMLMLTMVYISFAGWLCNFISSNFLLGGFAWGVIERVVLFIGTVLSAAAVVPVFYTAKELRRATGRDSYAPLHRDLLWGIAIGFAGFGIAWWFGTALLDLVLILAGIIVFAVVWILTRKKQPAIHCKALPAIGSVTKKDRISLAISYLTISTIILIQLRIIGDTMGAGITGKLAWLFFSFGLIGYFTTRFDSQVRIIDRAQAGGLIIGAISCVFIQSCEFYLMLADLGKWTRWVDWFEIWTAPSNVLAGFAIATQIPLAAIIGLFISQQRRSFAATGGTGGQYLSCCFAGAFHAMIFQTVIGHLGWGLSAWITLAVILYLLASRYTRKNLAKKSLKNGWAFWSIVLLAMLLWGASKTATQVHKTQGSLFAGSWLTSKYDLNKKKNSFTQTGLLGKDKTWRSQDITDCIAEIFTAKRGKWWCIATNKFDLPTRYPMPDDLGPESISRWSATRIPPGLIFTGSHPEPPNISKNIQTRQPALSFSTADFFHHARQNLCASFYDGIFIAPMPADHPQAWRCYNFKTLSRITNRGILSSWQTTSYNQKIKQISYGVVLLRTQSSPNNTRKALNVARTFFSVVKSGWAVVAINRKGIDMLLVGPEKSFEAGDKKNLLARLKEFKKDRHEIYLLPINKLWASHPGVKPIILSDPPAQRLSDTPKLEGLRSSLENASRVMNMK